MMRILPFVLLFSVSGVFAQETVGLGEQEAIAADAATMRLLQIKDGEVYLDGELLPDATPQELDLHGMSLEWAYDERLYEPVIWLDGIAYVLEDKKLIRQDDSTRAGEPVYPVNEQPANVITEAAAAQPVPPASPEAYFEKLSEEDQALYEKMQSEAQIENVILQLQQQIEETPRGEARDKQVKQLRELVTQAFDLRQEIHKEEVERARRQVEDLNDQLIDRADLREAIIDARMEELIGPEQ